MLENLNHLKGPGMCKMTKTKATKIARQEINMYRLGRQYVVQQYDDGIRAIRESPPRDYFSARRIVKEARNCRVNELLGEIPILAECYTSEEVGKLIAY